MADVSAAGDRKLRVFISYSSKGSAIQTSSTRPDAAPTPKTFVGTAS